MLKLGLTVISSTLILILKVHLLRLIIKRGVGFWYLLINSVFRDFKVLKLPLSHLCPFLLSYHRLLFAAAQPNTCLMASWRHLHCPHQSFAASAPIHELLYKISSHHSSRFGFFFPPPRRKRSAPNENKQHGTEQEEKETETLFLGPLIRNLKLWVCQTHRA